MGLDIWVALTGEGLMVKVLKRNLQYFPKLLLRWIIRIDGQRYKGDGVL